MINSSKNPVKILVELTITEVDLIDYALGLVVREMSVAPGIRDAMWQLRLRLDKESELARTTSDSDPDV